MRVRTMLAMAGLLAMPAVAMAQDGGLGEDPWGTSPPPGTTSPEQDGGMMPPGQQQGGEIGTGSDVRTGMEMGSQQVEIFRNKDNFEIRGTVSSVDPTQNRITVQRENLPPVELQVAQGTEIKMDGRASSLQALEPGAEVRARFNVAQDQPIAISLDAKRSRQMKKEEKRMERDGDGMREGDGMEQPGGTSEPALP